MGAASFPLHQWILYFLIILLLGYIVVDLLANHSDFPSFMSCKLSPNPSSSSSSVSFFDPTPAAADASASCHTLAGHLAMPAPPADSASSQDPWQQLKWIGRAAPCPVRGHRIEALDDANNFRRGFALRLATDVEDKTHLLPWLLASRVDLNRRPRRVYLDLGANALSTSITWFMRMYPVDFTEVHAFEIDRGLLKKPSKGFDESSNFAAPNQWAQSLKQAANLPQWMLDRINLYYKFVSDVDDVDNHAINITRFIKDVLKLTPSDTVVVKMDIEGSEWPILRAWMDDPDMVGIIDELFVEVHYDHPSMWGYHWKRFAPTTREEAKTLLAELRLHGFFAHAWP